MAWYAWYGMACHKSQTQPAWHGMSPAMKRPTGRQCHAMSCQQAAMKRPACATDMKRPAAAVVKKPKEENAIKPKEKAIKPKAAEPAGRPLDEARFTS